MLLNVTENMVFVTFCVKFCLKCLSIVILRQSCFVCVFLCDLTICISANFSFHAGDDCLI